MAGYTSTVRKYGEYIKPYDLDLIQKGLQYKQGKFEQNDMKIRQTIAQIGSMDLIKDEDKHYLLGNLNNLLKEVNSLGSLDLADGGVTRIIDNHISQSVDENVMNAYSSTKEIRNFQEEMKKLKEKGIQEGGWHPDNMAHAMRFVNKYMSDGKVGSKLSDYGGINYRPYYDVKKNVVEPLIGRLKEKAKSGRIDVVGPDGISMINIDLNNLTDWDIENLVANELGNNLDALEQLKIHTWARLGGLESDQSKQMYESQLKGYEEAMNNKLDAQITQLNTFIGSASATNEQKENARNNLKILESQKEGLAEKINFMRENTDAGLSELGRVSFISSQVSSLAPLYRGGQSYDIGKYSDKYRDDRNWAYKEAELELSRQKLALDMMKAGATSDGKGNIKIGDGDFVRTDEETELDPDFDAVEALRKDYTDAHTDLKSALQVAFDSVTRSIQDTKSVNHDAAKAIMEIYKKNGGDVSGLKGESKNLEIFEQAIDEAVDNGVIIQFNDPKGRTALSVGDIKDKREVLNIVDGYLSQVIPDHQKRARDNAVKGEWRGAGSIGGGGGRWVELPESEWKPGSLLSGMSKEESRIAQTKAREIRQGLRANSKFTIVMNNNSDKESSISQNEVKRFVMSLKDKDGNNISSKVDSSKIDTVDFITNHVTGKIHARITMRKANDAIEPIETDNIDKTALKNNITWFRQNLAEGGQNFKYDTSNLFALGRKLTSRPIVFKDGATQAQIGILSDNVKNIKGISEQEIGLIARGHTRAGLNNLYSEIINSNAKQIFSHLDTKDIPAQSQKLQNAISNLADKVHNNKYRMNLTAGEGGRVYITLNNAKGDEILGITRKVENVENIYNLFNTAPEGAFSLLLSDILKEQMSTQSTTVEFEKLMRFGN